MKDENVNPTPKNASAEVDGQPADLVTQICQCLTGRVTVPLDNVTSQTSFAELGVDSLSFLELIVDVEKKFGIFLGPDDAMDLVTVGDLEDYIRSQPPA
ncbi:acyl carrier protein [Planctomycetota bacterium]